MNKPLYSKAFVVQAWKCMWVGESDILSYQRQLTYLYTKLHSELYS